MEQDQICLTLQLGLVKEYVNVSRGQTGLVEYLRERGRAMVEKHLGDKKDAKSSAHQRLLLFRHDLKSPNMLQVLGGAEELENGTVVELVVTSAERPTRPHILSVATYLSPTFCDYGGCGEMLVGLVRQGLRCSKCGLNFHKKCAFGPHNNCSYSLHNNIDGPGASQTLSNFELPHTFVVHSYQKPTVCRHCAKLLVGIMKQGLGGELETEVYGEGVTLTPVRTSPSDPMETDAGRGDDVTMAEDDDAEDISTGDLIPLSRIPGAAAVKQGKQPKTLLEGWLLHFTNHQKERRLRHFWVLRQDCIHLCNEGLNTSRAYDTIQLSEILSLRSYDGPPLDDKYPPHCFEIVTARTIYYVGENLEWYARNGQGGPPAAKLPRRESGMGRVSGDKWYAALSQALLPPKLPREPREAEVPAVALEFSQLYQVNPAEELGSGQFGTVYAGVHRQTSSKVAIKVIAKDRFGKKQREQLRSEVGILQAVSHPGIIRLESMFETKDRIFVVMEKMQADMLVGGMGELFPEMILSSRMGRLCERVTRYLLVQILAALQYLHSRDIAHCDLKPENVLLSSPHTEFPQTKLCDFGYARFIGESQFRNTVVGTPAYLAPEVLQKKGYNKSLDQWSVGVVIYVTLSGTFPFNEGEEISEQIQNAAFMFPQNPWESISPSAVDLITRLLRLEKEERLSIDACLSHAWLKGQELLRDVEDLEGRLGTCFLTTIPAFQPSP